MASVLDRGLMREARFSARCCDDCGDTCSAFLTAADQAVIAWAMLESSTCGATAFWTAATVFDHAHRASVSEPAARLTTEIAERANHGHRGSSAYALGDLPLVVANTGIPQLDEMLDRIRETKDWEPSPDPFDFWELDQPVPLPDPFPPTFPDRGPPPIEGRSACELRIYVSEDEVNREPEKEKIQRAKNELFDLRAKRRGPGLAGLPVYYPPIGDDVKLKNKLGSHTYRAYRYRASGRRYEATIQVFAFMALFLFTCKDEQTDPPTPAKTRMQWFKRTLSKESKYAAQSPPDEWTDDASHRLVDWTVGSGITDDPSKLIEDRCWVATLDTPMAGVDQDLTWHWRIEAEAMWEKEDVCERVGYAAVVDGKGGHALSEHGEFDKFLPVPPTKAKWR